MTDPKALIEQAERNSGWRNDRHECVTDPALLRGLAQALRDLTAENADLISAVEIRRQSMREQGRQLREERAEVARLKALGDGLAVALFNATAMIGHNMPSDKTALVAGEKLVAGDVWKAGSAALAAWETRDAS